jgi:hypothetical protein
MLIWTHIKNEMFYTLTSSQKLNCLLPILGYFWAKIVLDMVINTIISIDRSRVITYSTAVFIVKVNKLSSTNVDLCTFCKKL